MLCRRSASESALVGAEEVVGVVIIDSLHHQVVQVDRVVVVMVGIQVLQVIMVN